MTDDRNAIRLEILRELRNPTEAMVEAGRELQSVGDETLYPEDFIAKWQAAIDVAIEEASRPRRDFTATPLPGSMSARP